MQLPFATRLTRPRLIILAAVLAAAGLLIAVAGQTGPAHAATPIPASFSLGTNTLVLLLTRKTTARIAATIHRARLSFRFMRISM